jgi:hypothetical protein
MKLVDTNGKDILVGMTGKVYHNGKVAFYSVDGDKMSVIPKAKVVDGVMKNNGQTVSGCRKAELIGKTIFVDMNAAKGNERQRSIWTSYAEYKQEPKEVLITEDNYAVICSDHYITRQVSDQYSDHKDINYAGKCDNDAVSNILTKYENIGTFFGTRYSLENHALGYGNPSFTTALYLTSLDEVTPDDLANRDLYRCVISDEVEIGNTVGKVVDFGDSSLKILLADGSTKRVKLGDKNRNTIKRTIVEKPEATLDMLSDQIKENFEVAMENSEVKVFNVETKDNKRGLTCGCGAFREISDLYFGRCIGFTWECTCGASYNMIYRDQNRFVFVVGVGAQINSFGIEEARCCSNCGNFHFSYGYRGKRSTGFCHFQKLCVLPHNTCKRWFPVDSSKYASNVASSLKNLGFSRDKYHNDSKPAELQYTEACHEANKEKAKKMKENYTVGYNNLITMILKKMGL